MKTFLLNHQTDIAWIAGFLVLVAIYLLKLLP